MGATPYYIRTRPGRLAGEDIDTDEDVEVDGDVEMEDVEMEDIDIVDAREDLDDISI